MTHFSDANYQKKIFFGRTWCSTWQWSDPPVFEGCSYTHSHQNLNKVALDQMQEQRSQVHN